MDAERIPLARYLPELERLAEAGTEFVLVAGQAVNFWADHYKAIEPELLEFVPFASKDVDLFGPIDDLYRLPSILDGELKRFKDVRTPVIGVFTTESDPQLKFELLRGVYGPIKTERVVERSRTIGSIRVIDALSLLVSKAYNAAEIDQETRQDIKHVKMMVLAARAHFKDGLTAIGDQVTPRQFINEVKYLLGFATHSSFKKGLTHAEATLADCVPMAELKAAANDAAPLERFIQWTLQPALDSSQ